MSERRSPVMDVGIRIRSGKSRPQCTEMWCFADGARGGPLACICTSMVALRQHFGAAVTIGLAGETHGDVADSIRQAHERAEGPYASTTLVVFGIGRLPAEELGRCQNGAHQLWKWAFAHGTANRAHSARECGVSQMVRAAALWLVYALPWLRYVSILEQR
ncbi:uncharacterized protein EMH_0041470 [Eimeria mitis]|uniref:Uncharacterized protein n=1 Tax=Eimeria mitis TaxID=44415 RepID=U6JSW7_9EIME|nr:uncharacterized protein EMH_0041470 [Eimeria mitis]CDJ28509.1 hypothetical protein EMH_0041470 [Eimeria mitis]